jgi:hypothetical protein
MICNLKWREKFEAIDILMSEAILLLTLLQKDYK